MRRIIFYGNGGAGNHGCEAITRSLSHILRQSTSTCLLSNSFNQDVQYGLDALTDMVDLRNYNIRNLAFWKQYLKLKLRHDIYALDIHPYNQAIKSLKRQNKYVALSIGGDNYCYGGTDYYIRLDHLLHKHRIPTAMVGCSIEPEVIANPKVNEDLKSHSLVIARESITYNSLLDNRITNVALCPDPAFALPMQDVELPPEFELGNTIGINLSPVVESYGNGENIIRKNGEELINYIITNTKYQIALIPHVVWDHNSDLHFMNALYNRYKESNRVIRIEDMNAMKLKSVISKCNMLITARTHASIAAYSTLVPTLVIGYSVKAKGLSKDIFGTSDNYVLPTQEIKTATRLIDSFLWLKENESSIKNHLAVFMPDYINSTEKINTLITGLL